MVKKWGPWVLKGALSAGLIWWLLSKADFAGKWDNLAALDPWMLALGLLLMLVQLAVGAIRWGVVLRSLGSTLGARWIGLYTYIGAFFAVVLPGGVGGDAMRIWYAHRVGERLARAVNSVMLDRASSVLTMAILVAMAQGPILNHVQTLPGTWFAWIFPGLSVLGVLGIVVLSVLDKLPEGLRRWRAVRALAYLAEDTRKVAYRPRFALLWLLSALLGNVNLSLVVWALARGLNMPVSVMDCMALVPPIFLFAMLPISIGGWGVREAAFVSAFNIIGADPSLSLLLSIVFGVLNIVAALPGGLVFLLVGGRHIPTGEELEAERAASFNPPGD